MKLLIAVALILLLCALPLHAETPSQIANPKQARRSWVADGANVLSPSNEARIDRYITQLERQTGAEIAVVTVHDLSGQPVDSWARQLFNRWGVGKKARDNGILLVAAINDHQMRIQVGYGLESTLTATRSREILDDEVKPYFRLNDFDSGVWAGVTAISSDIRASGGAPKTTASVKPRAFTARPTAIQPNPPTQVDAPPMDSYSSPPLNSSPSGTSFPWGWLAIPGAGLLGLGGWLFTRPQKCDTCDVEMNQLPEGAEDEFLTEEQEFEQQLGAVNWTVWKCPKCGKNRIVPHSKLFSSYHQCPRCRNRTARNETRVLTEATYDSTGTEEVTETCEWPQCRYSDISQRTIPRRERPSNSSSSSSSSSNSHFGGGSSGSGGASSSW